MENPILYDVTFAVNPVKRLLSLGVSEKFLACVDSVEDPDTFTASHLVVGKHLVPDYSAIRSALPHYHRKAFDRAGPWVFRSTPGVSVSNARDARLVASLMLFDYSGRLLGTLRAYPYRLALRTLTESA